MYGIITTTERAYNVMKSGMFENFIHKCRPHSVKNKPTGYEILLYLTEESRDRAYRVWISMFGKKNVQKIKGELNG